jgi:hypothetical protein
MKTKELAALLHGGETIRRDIQERAKAAGLVIVVGASDDLMEFFGAIRDEGNCYCGGTVRFDANGVLPEYEDLDRDNEVEMRDYFDRKRLAVSIEAKWCAPGGYDWSYETIIPHVTFDLYDNGDLYCRGIAFSMADAGLAHV